VRHRGPLVNGPLFRVGPSSGRCRLSPRRPFPRVRASPLPQSSPAPYPCARACRESHRLSSRQANPRHRPLPQLTPCTSATFGAILSTPALARVCHCRCRHHTTPLVATAACSVPSGGQGARDKTTTWGSTSPRCRLLTARPDCPARLFNALDLLSNLPVSRCVSSMMGSPPSPVLHHSLHRHRPPLSPATSLRVKVRRSYLSRRNLPYLPHHLPSAGVPPCRCNTPCYGKINHVN
jgi:hypothetical protein